MKDEDRVWRKDAVIGAITAAAASKRFSEGFTIAEEYQSSYGEWPDFWFKYSEFLLGLTSDSPDLAHRIFPEIEAALEMCIRLGDTPHISGSVPGRGSFLAEKNLEVLRSMP